MTTKYELMEVIDEHAGDMPDQAYIDLANALHKTQTEDIGDDKELDIAECRSRMMFYIACEAIQI
jgi:hypothetical protein